jgi:hypothetical protein
MFGHSEFFSGMITMGMLVCAVFFLRFWRRSKDTLFVAFALAFALLALSQALTTLMQLHFEERSGLYLLRFAAFSVLIVAILDKNLGKKA